MVTRRLDWLRLPEGVARRADLALTLLVAKQPTMLVNLKVINEYAKDYESCGPRGAEEAGEVREGVRAANGEK